MASKKRRKSTATPVSRARRPTKAPKRASSSADPQPPPSSKEVLAFFDELARSTAEASDDELRDLAQRARRFDLVGLSFALQDNSAVLALNRAANALLDAAIVTCPPSGERGHLLAIVRDILNEA